MGCHSGGLAVTYLILLMKKIQTSQFSNKLFITLLWICDNGGSSPSMAQANILMGSLINTSQKDVLSKLE